MGKVAVRVVARDAITLAGLNTILGSQPRIVLASPDTSVDVLLYGTVEVTSEDIRRLRGLCQPGTPIILLTSGVREDSLLALVECGVVGIVDRDTTTSDALGEALLAAANEHGMMPDELLGKLLGLVRTTRREALGSTRFNTAELTDREVEVLRMLAEGAKTAEIAKRLTYSESTIKQILHTLTKRFKFRNRVHAVACALRAGIL